MLTATGAANRFYYAAAAFFLGLLNAFVGLRDLVQDGRTDDLAWYAMVTLILLVGGGLLVRAGLRDLRAESTPEPSWMRPGSGDTRPKTPPSPKTEPRQGA